MPKISEILASFDAQKPNSIDTMIKTRWLLDFDKLTQNELSEIIRIEVDEGETTTPPALRLPPPLSGEAIRGGKEEDFIDNDELFIPDEFRDVYIYFLMGKVDFTNAEFTRYNNDMLLFTGAYNDFKAFYINRNKPNKNNKIIV